MRKTEIVARKEHSDSCHDHLDFGLLIRVDGKETINVKEAEYLELSEEDIATIQSACDKGWKIIPGEKHVHVTGSYEGMRYSSRFSIAISDILDRYDLWYED